MNNAIGFLFFELVLLIFEVNVLYFELLNLDIVDKVDKFFFKWNFLFLR